MKEITECSYRERLREEEEAKIEEERGSNLTHVYNAIFFLGFFFFFPGKFCVFFDWKIFLSLSLYLLFFQSEREKKYSVLFLSLLDFDFLHSREFSELVS